MGAGARVKPPFRIAHAPKAAPPQKVNATLAPFFRERRYVNHTCGGKKPKSGKDFGVQAWSASRPFRLTSLALSAPNSMTLK
jgi:hypothetical protein